MSTPKEFPTSNLGELLRIALERSPYEPIPEKLILGRHENVFSEPTLSRIRRWAEGKKIAVVDVHGILLSRKSNGRNRNAYNNLASLRNCGITLVTWSYGSFDRTRKSLKKYDLLKFFDLTIFRENYLHTSPETIASFVQATSRTPVEYQIDPYRLKGRKNPDLFGQFTVVLDDDLGHYPSRLVTSQNHKFIPIIPFDQHKDRIATAILAKKSVPFDESIVERVVNAFPKSPIS